MKMKVKLFELLAFWFHIFFCTFKHDRNLSDRNQIFPNFADEQEIDFLPYFYAPIDM